MEDAEVQLIFLPSYLIRLAQVSQYRPTDKAVCGTSSYLIFHHAEKALLKALRKPGTAWPEAQLGKSWKCSWHTLSCTL